MTYFQDETAIVFVVLNCISTEFTQRRHGGERGAPFRIQADVFKDGDAPYTAANCIQAVSCQVRVFKPRGADRKLSQDFQFLSSGWTANQNQQLQNPIKNGSAKN